MVVFSKVRLGVSPEINVLATITITVVTLDDRRREFVDGADGQARQGRGLKFASSVDDAQGRPMNNPIDPLAHAKDTLLDLAIRFGPKVLTAILILAVGLFVAAWAARAIARGLQRFDLEPPVRQLLTRVIRVIGGRLCSPSWRCRISAWSCCR